MSVEHRCEPLPHDRALIAALTEEVTRLRTLSPGEIGTLSDAVLADARVLRAEAYADSDRAEIKVHIEGGGFRSFEGDTFAEAVCDAAYYYGILPEPDDANAQALASLTAFQQAHKDAGL